MFIKDKFKQKRQKYREAWHYKKQRVEMINLSSNSVIGYGRKRKKIMKAYTYYQFEWHISNHGCVITLPL